MNPKILALAVCTAVLCGACTQQNPVPLVKSSEEDRTEATASYTRKPEQREATPRQTLQADRSFASGKIQLGQADPLAHLRPGAEFTHRERYGKLNDNLVKRVSETPLSTFSIDVDTGAYANVRRFLNAGQLPPRRSANRRTDQLLQLPLRAA